VTATEARLARIRGRAVPRSHNARTIAALASNPGCARRAIMDAAAVDKQRIAAYAGFPAPFGQSGFAFARGNAFEAQVKASGGAELLALLREHLNLPIPEAHYDDLSEVGGNASLDLRHAETRNKLGRAAGDGTDRGTMFDHPLLRLEVGGRHAYLEPDLIAFQLNGKFHVIEIKSFAVIDGHADSDKVAAAAIQSAVYVMALRQALAELGVGPEAVADETILVCPGISPTGPSWRRGSPGGRGRHWARITASSMAIEAPWAVDGDAAWAASPTTIMEWLCHIGSMGMS